MTNKSLKTRTEPESLVLTELRAAPQCSGAVHVTVVPYDDHCVPATWEVASFDSGTLCDIVRRLQQRFDIAQ